MAATISTGRTYWSKIDPWVPLVLGAGALISTSACVGTAFLGQPVVWLITLAAAAFMITLPVWLVRTTRYIVDEELLIVRAGPVTWKIPLREISAVVPTNNPLSSPAFSLDRLRIDYSGRQWVMISPREKEEFLKDLESRGVTLNPGRE